MDDEVYNISSPISLAEDFSIGERHEWNADVLKKETEIKRDIEEVLLSWDK